MVRATFELSGSTFTFGALGGDPSTIASPSQWNQIGTTRGVPSCHVYASRARLVECSSSCATGSSRRERSPCSVAISRSFPRYTVSLVASCQVQGTKMTIKLMRHYRHASRYGEDLSEAPHSATSFPTPPPGRSHPL